MMLQANLMSYWTRGAALLLGWAALAGVAWAGAVVPGEKDESPPADSRKPDAEPIHRGPSVIVLSQGQRLAGHSDDEAEIAIIQALDQPISFEASDLPIRDAIERIGTKAGIRVEMEVGALDLLPYGSRTMLSAKIENRGLGEALTAMLRPLGLTHRPDGRRLLIQPGEPLRRIVRRATWNELALLESLATKPWNRDVYNALKLQFQSVKSGDYDANRKALLQRAEAVGNGTAADVLEHACDQLGWAWHPEGEFIVILDKAKQIERQLEKRVTLRYVQTTLEGALLDLANRAGVLLLIDPGALASLPSQVTERFSLSIQNATIRQALEVVVGQTGLAYAIEPQGIRLIGGTGTTGPAPLTTAAGAGATPEALVQAMRSNSIIGYFTIPNVDGSTYTFFLREADLPPDVNEMRKNKIDDEVNRLRRRLFSDQGVD